MTHFDHSRCIITLFNRSPSQLPWVPAAFHARFPVSVKSFLAASPLVFSAFGPRQVGLRPTKLLVAREKKSVVPRVPPSSCSSQHAIILPLFREGNNPEMGGGGVRVRVRVRVRGGGSGPPPIFFGSSGLSLV